MKSFTPPLAVAAATLLFLAAPRPAHAQFFGQFGPLSAMPGGAKALGIYLGAGDGHVGPTGEFRINYWKHATAGLQATVESSVFGLQADTRAGLVGTGGEFPLELGGQLAGGLVTGGGSTSFYIQGVPGLSFEWDAGGGQSWSAWAGVGLRLAASTKFNGSSDGILRLGGRFQFSPELGLATNLEDVGGTSRLMVGGEYRFGGGGGGNQPR